MSSCIVYIYVLQTFLKWRIVQNVYWWIFLPCISVVLFPFTVTFLWNIQHKALSSSSANKKCLLSSPAVQLHIHYDYKGVMAWQFNKEQVVLPNPWRAPFLWIKTRCWFYSCRFLSTTQSAHLCDCICAHVVVPLNFHFRGLLNKSSLKHCAPSDLLRVNASLSWAEFRFCVNSLFSLSSPLTGSSDMESNHFIGAARNGELSIVFLLNKVELAIRH